MSYSSNIKLSIMKRFVFLLFSSVASFAIAQENPKSDTTKIKLGKGQLEMILIDHTGTKYDTIDASPTEEEKKIFKGHWSGIDVGMNTLINNTITNNPSTDFSDYPYWENNITKSYVWNLNLFEHKFKIIQNYVGITTGFGFNFNGIRFNDNYVLVSNSDTLYAVADTLNNYRKNKLTANYFTLPLLLEICSSNDDMKTFYLAAGVVGGLRLSSKAVRVYEVDGKKHKEVSKGTYGLNPFKLDAALRIGYGTWGIFANYSLLPLFTDGITTEVYPLTFGVTCNF